jgi:hypothetical protein
MLRLSYNVFFRDGVIEKVVYFESRGLDLYVEVWDELEAEEIRELTDFGIRSAKEDPSIPLDSLLVPMRHLTRIEIGATLP